ncbi:CoA transferase [Sphingomonas naphthae]|uniref:CoA transferase n=1 Tax=Sphingomonas naphthae TaxID=1813468 RepID=A0ABY7TGR8_9SPHN|nr:CoA transferase [Sphingomonas naphthae]WCT72171.1 CoA transferase [Sphingomonas naphthae]
MSSDDPKAPAQSGLALAGIKVIDFTHFVAGPVCTMELADFGADVVKVENGERGDDFRNVRPPEIAGEGGAFLWNNRNKRSIALDLTTDAGQAIARDLVRSADILVENYSGSVMERFGLSYETVSTDNPALIYCSISAYGREGPLGNRPGFDQIVQAETGLMSINGERDGPPLLVGVPVVDITAGMSATSAVLAALFARQRTGRGQRVDVALVDQAVSLLAYRAYNYLLTGVDPPRTGNSMRMAPPSATFEAADGTLLISCPNDRLFRKLCAALGSDALSADPRYATVQQRARHHDELIADLGRIFATGARSIWVERLLAAGVPAGPVASVSEGMASVEVGSRGLISQIPHPAGGTVPNIAPPYRLSGTPIASPRAAPRHGADGVDILTEAFGWDAAAIAAADEAGAFGQAGPRGRAA